MSMKAIKESSQQQEQESDRSHDPFDRNSCIERHIHERHGEIEKQDRLLSRLLKVMASHRSSIPTLDGSLLSLLNPEELNEIADKCKTFTIAEGGLLVKQDDAADCMYIILNGGFRILKDFDHSPPELVSSVEIGFLQTGDVVGDIGFLTGSKRGAFVQALKASEVVKITRSVISALQVGRPDFKQDLDRLVARHIDIYQEKNDIVKEMHDRLHVTDDSEDVLETISKSLNDLQEYRISIKTHQRDSWRFRPQQGSQSARNVPIPKTPLLGILPTARASSILQSAFSNKAGLSMVKRTVSRISVLEEKARKLRILIHEDTADDSSAWNQFQELLEQYPQCVNRVSSDGNFTLLHLSCIKGLAQICSTLLAHEADVNLTCAMGRSALHYLLLGDDSHMAQLSDGSLGMERMQIFRLLLAYRVRLVRDSNGISPIDLVAHEVPRLLLQQHLNQQMSVCALEHCKNRLPSVLCAQCKHVKYCDAYHAQLHWEIHKPACRAPPKHRHEPMSEVVGSAGQDDAGSAEEEVASKMQFEAGSETNPCGVSEGAYRRIVQTHKFLNLRHMGLDFIRRDKKNEDLMTASLFDQERLLATKWTAWIRFLWINRAELALRFRQIQNEIDDSRGRRPSNGRKGGERIKQGEKHAIALDGQQPVAGQAKAAPKFRMTRGKWTSSGVGKGLSPATDSTPSPGSAALQGPAAGLKFRAAAPPQRVSGNQISSSAVASGSDNVSTTDLNQAKGMDEEPSTTCDVLMKSRGMGGDDGVGKCEEKSDSEGSRLYTQLKERKMHLQELSLEDLKSVCIYLMPGWDLARRQKQGFPPLSDSENRCVCHFNNAMQHSSRGEFAP
jgi:CRP-like cAMP-binding protein